MSHNQTPSTSYVWASGLSLFGGIMLVISGLFAMLQGIAGLFKNEVYVVGQEYVFQLDLTAWGWIHLALGTLALLIGLGIIGRRTWALVAGICIALISALGNFVFLPYYPLWALVLIAMDVAIIWALSQVMYKPRV